MTLSEIQTAVDAIKNNLIIYEEACFEARAECIDNIDFHIIHRIDYELLTSLDTESLIAVRQEAERLKHKLEGINQRLFRNLRSKIRRGTYTKTSFTRFISQYITQNTDNAHDQRDGGYDTFDVFVNGLLSSRIIPTETVTREPEMVSYQPTPARIIFSLAEQARFTKNDVFFDLGAGLGHVCMLVNLFCGVTTKGIEIEPSYCEYARACANNLNLSDIEFLSIDARVADYARGTVFFLYTPFTGNILQSVLEKLQAEARTRPITLFTYGPCTLTIAQQAWLRCENQHKHNIYTLVEFKSI